MSPLHVSAFGGGVALVGSVDTRGVDEITEGDSIDIGPRGALVCASDVTPYLTLTDGASGPVVTHSLTALSGFSSGDVASVIRGASGATPDTYVLATFNRENGADAVSRFPFTIPPAILHSTGDALGAPVAPVTAGIQVTALAVAGTYPALLTAGLDPRTAHLFLVNVGARDGTMPKQAPGLYVFVLDASVAPVNTYTISSAANDPGFGFPVGSAWGITFTTTQTFSSGQTIVITGSAVPAVNGTFTIKAILGATQIAILGQIAGGPASNGSATASLLTPTPVPGLYPIKEFNALGTGPLGVPQLSPRPSEGTMSQQLYFRGIAGYNGYVFGWGFDSADAVNGDGPSRLMFCNVGNPLKWGNDNIGAVPPNNIPVQTVDRLFTDSDAIIIGSTGDQIRAALAIFGKLYIGTSRGLYFLQGFGRDSFVTNGAYPIMKAFNVVGPQALIEGPDKLMYGVSDQGLWSFDGGIAVPNALFQKVTSFDGHSTGWFDLIWTLPLNGVGYPGRTNQDLVWLAVDWARQQVLVGIPFCNATTGQGRGTDTVVLRYHTRTGGFTRQVFAGKTFTSAGYFRHENQLNDTRLLAGGTGLISRYGYQSTPATSPVMPAVLPSITLGPYAPWGPDGDGLLKRIDFTLAWESGASLPLVFTVTAGIDQRTISAYTLTIGPNEPTAPVQGDCWLASGGGPNNDDIGIGSVGYNDMIPARGGYVFYRRNGGTWFQISGRGVSGTRVTLPLPIDRVPGTRASLRVQTLSAAGRFQIEGLGFDLGFGEANV